MLYMGEIFKEIRQGRKLSLKEATGGEFSYSMLSRFENGESDISASKLLAALDNIHMELAEFSYLVRGYQPTDRMILQDKIWSAVEKGDLSALKALYEKEMTLSKTKGPHHALLALVVKGHMVTLDDSLEVTKEEETLIADYLFSVDIWGEYELGFFAGISPLLSLDLYFRYTRELLKKADFFKELYKQRNAIHIILLNGMFKALEERAMIKFAYFDKQLQDIFFRENDTYFRLLYRYAKGQELCLNNRVEEGLKQMMEVINILRLLDCQLSSDFYQQALENWQKKFE